MRYNKIVSCIIGAALALVAPLSFGCAPTNNYVAAFSGPSLNIRNFGALGDSTGPGTGTDNLAAIDAAIAAAPDNSEIEIPPGRYAVTGQIVVTGKRLRFRGVGGATIVEKTAITGTGSDGAILKFDGSDCDQSEVVGLGFEGAETLSTFNADAGADTKEYCAIRVEDADAVVLDTVSVAGKRVGVVLDTTTNAQVDRLAVFGILSVAASGGAAGTDNYCNGVKVKGGTKTTITRLVAKNLGSGVLAGVNGSSIDPSRLTVVGAQIENAWDNGIYVSSGNNSTIEACTVLTSSGSGVKVRGRYNVVSNCQIKDCLVGIGVSGAGSTPDAYGSTNSGCALIGNRIENIGRDGVSLDVINTYQVRGLQVIGNHFRDVATTGGGYCGIRGDGDGHQIIGNTFENVDGLAAVLLAGASGDKVVGCHIADNRMLDVSDGLRLQYVEDSVIANNTFESASNDAIELQNSVDNTFSNNRGGTGVASLISAAAVGNGTNSFTNNVGGAVSYDSTSAGTPTLNAANTFTTGQLIGGSDVLNALWLYRDATAGASSNIVQMKIGNSSSDHGELDMRYTNAAAAGSPTGQILFFPRNNAGSSNFQAGKLDWTKNGGSDTADMDLLTGSARMYQEGGTGDTGFNTNSPTATVDINGDLKVGSTGAIIQTVLSAAATLDFPDTATGASADLTITVTGAADGDVVSLGKPAASVPAGNCDYHAWVSGVDTVTVRFLNSSGGNLNPASGSFRAMVTKF